MLLCSKSGDACAALKLHVEAGKGKRRSSDDRPVLRSNDRKGSDRRRPGHHIRRLAEKDSHAGRLERCLFSAACDSLRPYLPCK